MPSILQPPASPLRTTMYTYLAIDVTTITPPPELLLPDSPVNPCKPQAVQARKVHMISIPGKFHGWHHKITTDLNKAHLTSPY